jgi:glycosyltransferase involved in cell wall biosynthesis
MEPILIEQQFPIVSIIVESTTDPTGSVTSHTLDSLLKQTYPQERLEIIFVDMSEGQQLGKIIQQRWTSIQVIAGAGLRYYEMKNIGAAAATGEIVCFIDSDVIWNSEWIHDSVKVLNTLPPYSAVVGLTEYEKGAFSKIGTISQFGHHWYKYAMQDYENLFGVIANNFAIRRSDFLAIQYRFTTFRQGMDMVLASDIQRRGGIVRLNPKMRATHKWGLSKIWEHPKTGYNVGLGLLTALQNCDYFLKQTSLLNNHLHSFHLYPNVEWILGGSPLAMLILVLVRFYIFYQYFLKTRDILKVKWFQVPAYTLFLAGFFTFVAIGALQPNRFKTDVATA